MREVVQWESRSGGDAYSGVTFDPAVPIQARWFDEVQVVRGDDRREVTSTAHVSTMAFVREGDRITDPSGRAREVIRVRVNRDTRGRYSHTVAYLA